VDLITQVQFLSNAEFLTKPGSPSRQTCTPRHSSLQVLVPYQGRVLRQDEVPHEGGLNPGGAIYQGVSPNQGLVPRQGVVPLRGGVLSQGETLDKGGVEPIRRSEIAVVRAVSRKSVLTQSLLGDEDGVHVEAGIRSMPGELQSFDSAVRQTPQHPADSPEGDSGGPPRRSRAPLMAGQSQLALVGSRWFPTILCR
jgi:hypothetical protein